MVVDVSPGRIDRLLPVVPLAADLHRAGGGGVDTEVPRSTCTGHWHTSTKVRLSGGTAKGGGGAD